jgi:AcrR family transcriptional regulator
MEYNDKQLQIMEVAESLFAEKGFNGTSIRDIALKANINLAMISYYFGSKEKLLEAMFGYRGEQLKVKIEDIIGKKDLTAIEKVYLLIDNYIEKIMQQQCFHRIMAREQVLNTTGFLAELITGMKKTNLEVVSRLIKEGQKTGDFRKNIDIPLMMTTMVGTANHLITTKHHYKEMSNAGHLTEKEFENMIRKKLGNHLKFLFKVMLTHED